MRESYAMHKHSVLSRFLVWVLPEPSLISVISTLFFTLSNLNYVVYFIFITPFIVNAANFPYHRLVLQLKNSYICAKIK